MNDLLKWLFLCAAILAMLYAVGGHEQRLIELENRPVYVPSAKPSNCRPMQSLLKNRPIPPIHSYAKPHQVCEEKS